jgi:hypothetical protein
MARRELQTSNLASEFYVASQFLRLGYVTTVTLGHTKEIDLIVAHPDGRTVTIDVKGLKNTTNWPLTPKLRRRSHFYVLVSYLNKFADLSAPPEVFIVPSVQVKRLLWRWPGRPDVTAVRYSKVRHSKYRAAWHLLFK